MFMQRESEWRECYEKELALGLALILACGTLAGCGGSGDSSEGSSEGSGDGSVTAKVIDIDLTSEEYAFGVDKNQPELLDQVNGLLPRSRKTAPLMKSAINTSERRT